MHSDHKLPAAAIFDMDGVLVDSNPYHLQKWAAFLDEHGIPYDPVELPRQILGCRNDSAFRFFFGSQLTSEEMKRLDEELEAKFREMFAPHAKPLPGLERLIEELYHHDVPMAVASSAISKNVEFIIDALKLRPYLRTFASGDEVSHAKPDPEIYLKAAGKLAVDPALCVTFEDSFVGVEAAKRAGMKCVAIASTFPAEELRQQTRADLIVPTFEVVDFPALQKLFESTPATAGKKP
jgi:beta-phosphoglucomutase